MKPSVFAGAGSAGRTYQNPAVAAFSLVDFARVLPQTVRQIAVLDRTKEPGAVGDPLYLDVVTALSEAVSDGLYPHLPKVIAGRYGLSSKEFTPAMVVAVFSELAQASPRRHFTIGINDDVSNRSLDFDDSLGIEPADVVRAVFFGLGSDGTVGSNKTPSRSSAKRPTTSRRATLSDSRKAGAVTVSHLRFGRGRFDRPTKFGARVLSPVTSRSFSIDLKWPSLPTRDRRFCSMRRGPIGRLDFCRVKCSRLLIARRCAFS